MNLETFLLYIYYLKHLYIIYGRILWYIKFNTLMYQI